METNNKSTRLTVLKQKLQAIESQTIEMSPAPKTHPPFDAVNEKNYGNDENINDRDGNCDHLNVSGFAPLDDSVCDGTHLQQQYHSYMQQRHSSPRKEELSRVRHASDQNVALAESKRNVGGDSLTSEANFNGGLTLPTSATKKKAGLRSYLSTPDTRALVDFGHSGTTSGDETGPRKRSLGKARRVLKTSESTSPKDNLGGNGEEAGETTKNGGSAATSATATQRNSKIDESIGLENLPHPYSLGTINESEDGLLLQYTKDDDLILSDLRLSDDYGIDSPNLNASFADAPRIDVDDDDDDNYVDDDLGLLLNNVDDDVENVLHISNADRATRMRKPAITSGSCEKKPLRELHFYHNNNNNNNNNYHKNESDYSHPRNSNHCQNPASASVAPQPPPTSFPHTPLQHKNHQSLYNNHQHPGSRTPLHSMPPPPPLFTPAQPQTYAHHHQQPPSLPPHARKQKFVHVNGVAYQLIRTIGSGGSCKVYQAADFDKQRLIAIKIVDLDEVDQAMIDSYKNEIVILKKLQHSNRVVRLLDHEISLSSGGGDDNLLHIVMECGDCDLATLFNERVQKKNITRNLVRFYWEEMLACIAVIHAEGIVHSDLKPANFLVVNGTLKLIDFGIANAIQSDKTSVTRDSQIGTLNYMSPEAILDTQPPMPSSSSTSSTLDGGGGGGEEEEGGKPRIKIGTKSDVWSLGCILYSMVYSKTPFHHLMNHLSKIQAIINPRYNIRFNDVGNDHLLDVMQKCLTREPKARPSVDQLLAHPYLRG